MNMLSRQSVPGNSVSAHLSLDDSTPVNGDFGLDVDVDNDMLDIDRALSFDPANDQIVGVDLNNINATFSTGVDSVNNDRMDVDTEIDGTNGKARDGVAETPEEEVVPLTVVKPKWMIDAKDHLLAIEGGEGWNQLVHDWMEFERLLGYPDCEVSIFILTIMFKIMTHPSCRIEAIGFLPKVAPKKSNIGMPEARNSRLCRSLR